MCSIKICYKLDSDEKQLFLYYYFEGNPKTYLNFKQINFFYLMITVLYIHNTCN